MASGLMLKKLVLKNLLSFGPEGVELELGPLNVLIGPNASGKSNLIDAIRFLSACADDFTRPLSDSGGLEAWINHQEPRGREFEIISTLSKHPKQDAWYEEAGHWSGDLTHRVAIWGPHRPQVLEEEVWITSESGTKAYYRFNDRLLLDNDEHAVDWDTIDSRIDLSPRSPVVAKITRLPAFHRLNMLYDLYSEISVFGEWSVTRGSPIRQSQPADSDSRSLLPDASNLALVLNDLDSRPEQSQRLVNELRNFYPRAKALKFRISYGRVEAYVREEELQVDVPFTRLSDGTIRWLCLLAILIQPKLPNVICLEEPEIGLHPDMLLRLAELLVEASERTQLIVTTHSDFLLSCLSGHPESIVVCEHNGRSTDFRRLDSEPLKEFLEEYRLGDAWIKGEIGGTRY